MKKLSVLIALALCLTIGGVYAAWNYSQGNVQTAYGNIAVGQNHQISITEAITDNSKGTISVDATNLKFVIDDTGSHVAGLTITGSVKVSFTPNPGADEEVATNGIPLKFVLNASDEWKYGGNKIFEVNSAEQIINSGNRVKTEIEILASTFESLITLNDVTLDEFEDYENFHAALHSPNGGITIAISEYVAP